MPDARALPEGGQVNVHPYRGGGQPGIELCPRCEQQTVGVTDSRPGALGRVRRRRCRSCGHRWTTIELIREDALGLLAQEAVERALVGLRATETQVRELIAALEQATDA